MQDSVEREVCHRGRFYNRFRTETEENALKLKAHRRAQTSQSTGSATVRHVFLANKWRLKIDETNI